MTKRIIDEKELSGLLEDSAVLCALLSGGVDNWDWYEESLETLELPGKESLAKYPISFAESENSKLQYKLETAIKTLRFYASKEHWNPDRTNEFSYMDGWELAQDCLKEIEE